MKLRVGVAGTGTWAQRVHLPAIAANPNVSLAGVWGRDHNTATEIAEKLGVRAFPSFQALIDETDIVDLAVVPAVQPDYALQAASRGRHLILEKPLGTHSGQLKAISGIAREAGIAATIFLGRLFDPARADWMKSMAGQTWESAEVEWISSSFLPGNQFAAAWRDQAGALFDIGPHILSQLEFILGPITDVEVTNWDRHGDIRFELHHESGATSRVLLNVHTEIAATRESLQLRSSGRQAKSPDHPINYCHAFGRMMDLLVSEIGGDVPPDNSIRRASGIDAAIRTVQTIELIRETAVTAGRSLHSTSDYDSRHRQRDPGPDGPVRGPQRLARDLSATTTGN